MVDVAHFRAKALAYRALASTAGDPVIHRELLSLAEHYEQMAVDAEPLPLPRGSAPAPLHA